MKKFLAILVLGLLLITPSQADDIQDFQIEGMSIGDSLLKHMSLADIEIAEENSTYYKDKKFVTVFVDIDLNQYEELQVVYKPNDKKFIIHEIKGNVDYEKNIHECKKLKKKVSNSLIDLFNEAEEISEIKPHEYDKSKNTIVDSTWLYPKGGGYVHIACTDYGTEMYEKHGWTDTFNVTIGSEEFRLFLAYEAYK